jgi:hypothetical protein
MMAITRPSTIKTPKQAVNTVFSATRDGRTSGLDSGRSFVTWPRLKTADRQRCTHDAWMRRTPASPE